MEGPIVAAGLSGHGFEIAPAVGELVADLVVECHVDSHSGDPRIPAGDFRLSRCTENALLKSRYPGAAAGQMR